MSTRSVIALKYDDGSMQAIYCHSDGYPNGPHGVGYKLLHYWQNPADVYELMALGDLSILGVKIGKKHDFDKHHDSAVTQEYCRAYGRDRGDEGVQARTYDGLHQFKCGEVWESDREWVYVGTIIKGAVYWHFGPANTKTGSAQRLDILTEEAVRGDSGEED